MTPARHLLLGISLLPALAAARPDWSHPALEERVGPPDAPYAMPGGDAARSRRSTVLLSRTPHVERRLRVAYGIGKGLITYRDGGFFTLHASARASRFDAQGKLMFSIKLPGEPSSAPAMLSSGAVAFTAGGELLLAEPSGKLRRHADLNDSDFVAKNILATRDGGVLLVGSSTLVKLSATGNLMWQRRTPETVLDVLEATVGLLCVTAPGAVYRLDSTGRLTKLGELGATVNTVTAGGRQLLARTGEHRLARFDLFEHRLAASIEDATLTLDGPALLAADGSALAFTLDGLLVRYRPDGGELQRIPVDPGARKAPGSEDALLLGDGTLALARAGADVVIVTPSGEVSTVPGSACPDPVGVFPVGQASVLLACRSGNVIRIE